MSEQSERRAWFERPRFARSFERQRAPRAEREGASETVSGLSPARLLQETPPVDRGLGLCLRATRNELVEVRAAGINPVDTYFGEGSCEPFELPITPGVDFAVNLDDFDAAVGEALASGG